MILRDYQQEMKGRIRKARTEGHRNLLIVMPTGAGKTVQLSDEVKCNQGATAVIAHRQELVSQISVALARNEVRHRIIAPDSVIKFIVSLHIEETGRSYYNPVDKVAVAGVDTLLRRAGNIEPWLQSVTLWVTDEAHHITTDNKWGKAVRLFPNALGLGVTATPLRADGQGLGRHADGVFDKLIVGPSMRDLINRGFLTDYRIFAPPTDLDLSEVAISARTGDFNKDGVRKAVHKSKIVGDVVEQYIKHAQGSLGVTFAVDVETATQISGNFNDSGVRAEVVSAKTPGPMRVDILRRFRNREILQLVNVDLFGEGFDLPAIETVSMARPTASYALFAQQFGRGLRILEGKTSALIIDHVGNCIRHGLPDMPKAWTLDRAERRSRGGGSDAIPVRACPSCTGVYERIFKSCPYCGYYAAPTARNAPEEVEGDLLELDAATLAAMRGEVAEADLPPDQYMTKLIAKHVPTIGRISLVKKHARRQEAQKELRGIIQLWGQYNSMLGRNESEAYRRFYYAWGIDVLSAQALKEKDARSLTKQLRSQVSRWN